MKKTTTVSRYPEMPGQQPDAKQNGQQTAPVDGQHTAPVDGQHTAPAPAVRSRPFPSVRPAAPDPGTHGRIADGGGPQSRLEARMRWSAGGNSDRGSGL